MDNLFSLVVAEQHTAGIHYDFDNRVRQSDAEVLVVEHVISGNLRFECAGKEVLIGPSQAFIFAHGEASRYWIDTTLCDCVEVRYAAFIHPPSGLSAAALRVRLGQVFELPKRSEASEALLHLIETYRSGRTTGRFANSRLSYDLLMRLLTWSTQEETVQDPIERTREWLLDHYTQAVGIKEVAYHIGISREHLTRQFSERFGETPGSMLGRLRMERAEQLLRLTYLPMQEVARRSGFGHVDTLTRQCRARHGKTPLQLRESQA